MVHRAGACHPRWAKAEAGGILKAMEIKAAFEAEVGKVVAKTTIHRMLGRCNGRNIAPRPRHPRIPPWEHPDPRRIQWGDIWFIEREWASTFQ